MKSFFYIFCMGLCSLALNAEPDTGVPNKTVAEVSTTEKEFIGINEKLGSYIPLDGWLTDDQGRKYQLKEVFDKPVLFSFVYYRCPGICSPLLAGKSRVLRVLILYLVSISMS